MNKTIHDLANNQFNLLEELDKSDLPLNERIKLSHKICQSIHNSAKVILQYKRHAVQAGEIFDGKDVVFEQPKAIEQPVTFYTIVKYFAEVKGIDLDGISASTLGASAARYCRKHDVVVKTEPHLEHGMVKSYPKQVLDTLFALL